MKRSFDAALELSDDGRTVTGRIFPFGVVAHVRDLNELGEIEEFDEEFLSGCTARMQQVAAKRGGSPAWIRYTVDHEQTFDARLGYCTTLSERSDGAWAEFRLYDGPHLPKVRSMIQESHKGLSVEFVDVVPPVVRGSLRQRRQINIAAVTATPIPVYTDAVVMSVRGEASPLDLSATPNLDEVERLLTELRA